MFRYFFSDFKTNTIGGPIELVDEYQIFCHLLQIRAKAHNGTWENVRHLLKGDPSYPFGSEPPPPTESTSQTSFMSGGASWTPTSPTPSAPAPSAPAPLAPAPSVPAPVRRPAEEPPPAQNEVPKVAARPPTNRRQSQSSAISLTSQFLFTCILTVAGGYLARHF